ncbi:MAG TPA: aldo/keto reductase [Povalibacter sp.]|uniref:aldo/keto reductase n=1 Tax=Povalibacter sp. TaxID=1962978 RepID=UPI002D059F9F|nr:aldo/keto reductase [Povalibacter sp.]HMN42987.1 aldo/keto reductase [Povalibacter sp.]
MLIGAAAAGVSALAARRLIRTSPEADMTTSTSDDTDANAGGSGMRFRDFGGTGLKVSEVGFGSWAIGGQGYGAVDKSESLRVLARAEELGCNFVDTAAVYGESERVLGEFLEGRRSKWIVATKYSGQDAGLTATLERQLADLRTDVIDYYQLHWVPSGKDAGLFDELAEVRKAGKVRFIGVSLYTVEDIDFVLGRVDLDGFQVAFNLLQPDPFMARLGKLHEAGKAIIVRSALREGFLTGKFKRDATFPDPADQRHRWTREQIERTVEQVERFRFLEQEAGSMVQAAVRYPLSFPEVSTVIMGTKSLSQAKSNFGQVPGGRLSAASLGRIQALQVELGLGDRWPRWLRRFGIR